MPPRPSTRDALLAAAEDLLSAGQVHVSISAITAAAGVGVGSFYNYFESKESLFALAAQQAFADFEADMMGQTSHITDPAERLCTRVRIFCRISETHPRLARIIVNAAPLSLVSRTGYSPAFEADVHQAVEAGELDGTDVPLKLLAIAAGAERLVSQSVVFPPLDAARVDDFAGVALHILGMDREKAHRLANRPLQPWA